MRKFTFSKTIPTGYYRTFEREHHDIKLDGHYVGDIFQCHSYGNQPHPDEGKFAIQLMIRKKYLMEDGNKNCPWKMVSLKFRGNTAQECKDVLTKWGDKIQAMHDIYLPDPPKARRTKTPKPRRTIMKKKIRRTK